MSAADVRSESEVEGATVVITHRIAEGRHAEYDAWLEEIGPLCRAARGNLDWHIVRPVAGLTDTYTVIVRFDGADNLARWMQSPVRARFIERIQPLLAEDDRYVTSSGLDFWFQPKGAKVAVPVRWKQYLVTWSAIYPLALATPLLVRPALRALGAAGNNYVTTFVVTGVVVFLMVYVVMPRYTALLKRWLFR